MMPAKVFGAGGVGGPGSSLGTFLTLYSGLTFGGLGQPEALQVITVDDPLGTGGGPFFSAEFVIVGDIEDVGGDLGFPSLPDAPQAGAPDLIEVNDRRALDAVWRDNSLWVTTTVIANNGPDLGQTTAHWFELDTSDGPGAIVAAQGGYVGGEDIAAGAFTYFPSVAVNRQNEAKIGFSASAPTIFAGAYVAGRKPGDAPGSLRTSGTVKAGEAPYKRYFGGTRNRWGDYSGISVDPSNDDFFWVFNEFADEQGSPGEGSEGPEDGRWGTAWGRCKFVGAGSKMDFAGEMGDPLELDAVAKAPQSYALNQNYPNPFNPTTAITFSLAEKAKVHLAVYDMLGRQVGLLSDDELPAGEHTVTFVANDLPSGLYLLRMSTSDRTFTRRMQLVK
jgi:hypothetical protein